MATTLPPRKKRKANQDLAVPVIASAAKDEKVWVQFVDANTRLPTGQPISLSAVDVTQKNLNILLNTVQGNDASNRLSYRFTDTTPNLSEGQQANAIDLSKATSEIIKELSYEQDDLFRVKVVTRCNASMKSGSLPVFCARFSPASSSRLLTGSGDNSARLWDCDTGTPYKRLQGHTQPVIAISWSPDAALIATGSRDKTVRLWDPKSGEPIGVPMTGHGEWINAFAWEPYHLAGAGMLRLASASKDTTVRIWNTSLRRIDMVLSGHTSSVYDVKWGGENHLYTSSRDQTIKIWDGRTGALLKTLKEHSHWVNSLALSTDAALQQAFYDRGKTPPGEEKARREQARARFYKAAGEGERLVSSSDDKTLCLWNPKTHTLIRRMHGHQGVVNHVRFSDNGAFIASAGFDNLVKLWNGRDGAFLATFKGHVSIVYRLSFSADSRLLVTCSRDSTVKVWDIRTRKLKEDLPGHRGEVYDVHWSTDGEKVASVGEDGTVKLWRH